VTDRWTPQDSVDRACKASHNIDELKQRLIDTWDCIPQGIIDKARGYLTCEFVNLCMVCRLLNSTTDPG